MVRITKVHTGVGDKGNTVHLDGTHVSKSDLRLDVVGAIDELNSIIGGSFDNIFTSRLSFNNSISGILIFLMYI